MNKKITPLFLLTLKLFFLISCKVQRPINYGNDTNFKIIVNADKGLKRFNRKVEVFGIDIYAATKVDDTKLLHAVNVMAQYLDNNEDGIADDQLVLDKMIENKAYLVMWYKQSDLRRSNVNGRIGQDLGNEETHPDFVSNGKINDFDATLEEVLHLINNAGHSFAYPDAFGQKIGSNLANAMDIARGGQFMTIPKQYPSNTWFSYDDNTCDYANCQTIEYLYWALTSILGAQENRLDEIENEWKLNTKLKVETTDSLIFSLLSNPAYKMPKLLPDGTYRH